MSQQSRLSTIALVALLALSTFAATASAAPLSMTFTESRANVGLQLDDDALFEAPDIAPLDAEIDPANGSITDGFLEVPQFSTFITDPIDADVAVDFEIGVISGSFNQATGALSLQGTAGGVLTANGKECTVSTTPSVLTVSTTGNSGGTNPRSGAPFSSGLAGPGAIAGEWTDMQATPVDPGPGGDTIFCEDVEDQIGGAGGVWLEQAGEPLSMTFTFITDPIDADVAVDFEIGVITGSFNQATGALSLSGEAGGTLTADGKECTVSTTPSILTLSTAGNSGGTSPRSGAPFTAGLTGVGAIAGQWTDMHATPVDPSHTTFCEDVEDQIGGLGGVWLEQAGETVSQQPTKPTTGSSGGNGDTTSPPPPPPPACTVPKLAGKTLARAKTALKAANCKLGKVHKPKPRKGQGQPALAVKASTPAAGTSPANGKVHLRLGPKS